MPIPEWVERLRTASFVSPSGVESTFKLDILSRIGGKKASSHEILNSDEAIQQDQGNRSTSYPIEAYFTGTNGDQEADIFYKSLEEKYTTESPGLFRHPLWGDIPVMPFTFQESAQLVTGAGIFRVPCEFRQTSLANFPTPSGGDIAEITAAIDEIEVVIETANENIEDENPSNYAQLKAIVSKIVTAVDNALSPIADLSDDIMDTYRLIKEDINEALDAGADIIIVLNQVNRLIRIPAKAIADVTTFVDTTVDRVTSYYDMSVSIIRDILDYLGGVSDEVDKANIAEVFQSTLTISITSTAEAALATDFQTRDAAGYALDLINELEATICDEISTMSQNISGFDADHNTALSLSLIIGMVNGTLIDISFDLKSKRITILAGPSDAITLTWKFYRDMSQLDFFIQTNDLQDLELIEIPAGRQIVSYA